MPRGGPRCGNPAKRRSRSRPRRSPSSCARATAGVAAPGEVPDADSSTRSSPLERRAGRGSCPGRRRTGPSRSRHREPRPLDRGDRPNVPFGAGDARPRLPAHPGAALGYLLIEKRRRLQRAIPLTSGLRSQPPVATSLEEPPSRWLGPCRDALGSPSNMASPGVATPVRLYDRRSPARGSRPEDAFPRPLALPVRVVGRAGGAGEVHAPGALRGIFDPNVDRPAIGPRRPRCASVRGAPRKAFSRAPANPDVPEMARCLGERETHPVGPPFETVKERL